MPEIYPKITYSPEGVLQLYHSKNSDGSLYPRAEKSLEVLMSDSSSEIVETDANLSIRMDVRGILENIDDKSRYGSSEYKRIINQLEDFASFDFDDPRDGVFSLDWWGSNGATGVVYPHLQRWMNSGSFTEEVARGVFDAMVEPYGKSEKKELNKFYEYKVYSNGIVSGLGGMSVSATLRNDEFGITQLGDGVGVEKGTVEWSWANLSTVGSCACWGVDGDDRRDIILESDSTRLYEMQPHNVDAPIQSLSLALGMARIAYEASYYQGQEDIFQNVQWSK